MEQYPRKKQPITVGAHTQATRKGTAGRSSVSSRLQLVYEYVPGNSYCTGHCTMAVLTKPWPLRTHSGGTISPSASKYECMAYSGNAIPRSYWYQVVRTALMYSCEAVLFCVAPELWVQRRAERSREPRQVPQDRRDDADSILWMVTVAYLQTARRDTAYTSSKATRVCCISRRQTR